MSTSAAPNTRMALTLAIGLYLVWVLATYLLEGRIHTLLRPEDMGASGLDTVRWTPEDCGMEIL